jgi:hypothetical protein
MAGVARPALRASASTAALAIRRGLGRVSKDRPQKAPSLVFMSFSSVRPDDEVLPAQRRLLMRTLRNRFE